MVAIPRRQIKPDSESLSTAGIDKLAHYVTASAPEWTGCNGMCRRLCRPQTESVVMLRGQHNRPETGSFRCAGPLPRIERGGVEDRRRFLPVSPLTVREGVYPEVDEECELVAMPLQLAGRGHRPIHRRQRHSSSPRQCASGKRQCAEVQESPAVELGHEILADDR